MGKEGIGSPQKEMHLRNHQSAERGPIFLGAGMLVIGFLLLAGQLLHISFEDFLWPFIFIVPGALIFLSAIFSEDSSGEGLSILGGILCMLGFIFLLQAITGLWASWAYVWALVAPTSIGLSQMIYGNLKHRDTITTSGRRLTKVGLSIFVAGFLFFEIVLGISGFGLKKFGIPVFPMVLIFIGGFVLARSFVRSKTIH
ncbi:MAG: hypothetical protein J7K66_02665 [Anaerolineaceae bacterium]|nr:hypothetical protein [Anaerolineaceae bacterium]